MHSMRHAVLCVLNRLENGISGIRLATLRETTALGNMLNVIEKDRNGQSGTDSAHTTTRYYDGVSWLTDTEALLRIMVILHAVRYKHFPFIPAEV